MPGRLRDIAILVGLAVAFNVGLTGSFVTGSLVALAELAFLGLIMFLSLYVRP